METALSDSLEESEDNRSINEYSLDYNNKSGDMSALVATILTSCARSLLSAQYEAQPWQAHKQEIMETILWYQHLWFRMQN